jgi:hypothetical protein
MCARLQPSAMAVNVAVLGEAFKALVAHALEQEGRADECDEAEREIGLVAQVSRRPIELNITRPTSADVDNQAEHVHPHRPGLLNGWLAQGPQTVA